MADDKIVSIYKPPVSNVFKKDEATWDDLYKILMAHPIELPDNSAETKAKYGHYFVRGVIKSTNGKTPNRSDKYLSKCYVIILDIDKELPGHSLPTPKQIHKVFKEKKIQHVVHSSATPGRCRVILPVEGYNKETTDQKTWEAFHFCVENDLLFQFAGESKTKSQPWFMPQTTDLENHQAFGLKKGKSFNPSFCERDIPQLSTLIDKTSTDKTKDNLGPGDKQEVQNSENTQEKQPATLEWFLDQIKYRDTQHEAVKRYAGWLKRTTNYTHHQIFDQITYLIKENAPPDKVKRWEEWEGKGWQAWFDENHPSETIEDIEPTSAWDLWETEPPAREWLINGILTRNAVNITSGEGGIGKSNLSLLIALLCASGKEMGPFKPSAPLRVMMVNAEDPLEEIHRRIYSFNKYDKLEITKKDIKGIQDNLIIYPVRGKIGGLMELDKNHNPRVSSNGRWLRSVVEEKKPDLVILDTKSRLYGLNENDNDDAAKWLAFLEGLCENTQASFIVISHTGKANQSNSGSSYASRGASAIGDNARSAITVSKLSDAECVEFGVSQYEYFKMTITKSNYSDKHGKEWIFKKEEEGLPVCVELKNETTELILAYIREGEHSYSETYMDPDLREETGQGQKGLRQILDNLIKTGKIIKIKVPGKGRKSKEILAEAFGV